MNAVVVCGRRLLQFFRFRRHHLHGVDAFAAGVAIDRSVHPVSAAGVLSADDARQDHFDLAAVVVVVVVVAAAAADAAAVVAVVAVVVVGDAGFDHAFVDDDGAAVGVGPLTSPAVDASAAHAVHAVLPFADHVPRSVVPLVSY